MRAEMRFVDVAEVADAEWAYEHGWQSWSPSGRYPATATSPRPRRPHWQFMGYRPGRPAPASGFQGEGLLAVECADGSARLWAAPEPARSVPSIRARAAGDRVVVSADGPVEEHAAPSLAAGLIAWADAVAARLPAPGLRALGPGWCSWYCHWHEVTEKDVARAIADAERLELDVAVIQVDDGHQAEIGDWLARSQRFGPLGELGARICGSGREAGIWSAPFLVGHSSRLAAEHPDWLVRGAVATHGLWHQDVGVLDVTHPAAAEHLAHVYRELRAAGFTYHKLDFLYAGALDGGRHADADPLAAYRQGLGIVRAALGPEATILGCGAPLLPSLGLVDAMRVSPDVDPGWEPPDGDVSQPGMRSAVLAGRVRAWQHGRWWINDPDCLVLRPGVERRGAWAAHLEGVRGLRASSDRLGELDERGLALTRRLLQPADPAPHAAPAVAALLEPL